MARASFEKNKKPFAHSSIPNEILSSSQSPSSFMTSHLHGVREQWLVPQEIRLLSWFLISPLARSLPTLDQCLVEVLLGICGWLLQDFSECLTLLTSHHIHNHSLGPGRRKTKWIGVHSKDHTIIYWPYGVLISHSGALPLHVSKTLYVKGKSKLHLTLCPFDDVW